jgi:hypothetical protein
MLAPEFQLQGFIFVVVESVLMVQGPFSVNSPCRELTPGPPLSQIESGASLGSFREGKYQKKVLIGYG